MGTGFGGVAGVDAPPDNRGKLGRKRNAFLGFKNSVTRWTSSNVKKAIVENCYVEHWDRVYEHWPKCRAAPVF
jgi:hypothetical protein